MWADLRCGGRPKTLRVCASIPPEMRKGIIRLLYLSICVVCMHALCRLCVPHTAGLCFASKDSIPSMSSCDSRRGRLRTGCSSQTRQTKPFPDARSCSVDAPRDRSLQMVPQAVELRPKAQVQEVRRGGKMIHVECCMLNMLL